MFYNKQVSAHLFIRRLHERISTWFESDRHFAGFLVFVTFFIYGLFIPWLGYYGDDWSKIFLLYHQRDITSFFVENRPWLSPIYTAYANVVGPKAWQWHSVLLCLRIILAWMMFKLGGKIWPDKSKNARWVALLALVYPGFLISHQPLTFLFHYIQSICFFGSLWLTAIVVKQSAKKIPWMRWFVAVLLGFFSLLISEYFYFLELMRIPVAYLAARNVDLGKNGTAISKPWKLLLPHTLVFLLMSVWRWFNQANISRLGTEGMYALLRSPNQWIQGLWAILELGISKSGLAAWVEPIWNNMMITVIISSGLIMVILIGRGESSLKKQEARKDTKMDSVSMLVFGCLWLMLAMIPFWLAGVQIRIGLVQENRFLFPAAYGSACLVIGLIDLLPWKRWRNELLMMLTIQACIAQLSAGFVFVKAHSTQKDFFSQILARVPAITAGTSFLFNSPPLWMQSENSIASVLNLLYMDENQTGEISAYVYYDKTRFENEIIKQEDGIQSTEHLIGSFRSERGKLLLFDTQAGGCLKLDENTIPFSEWTIPEKIPTLDMLASQGTNVVDKKYLDYFLDRPRSFCQIYQRAIVLAQVKDWKKITDLGSEILYTGIDTAAPSDLMIFIKASLLDGKIDQAVTLSREAAQRDRSLSKPLCKLWREKPEIWHDSMVTSFLQNELLCLMNVQP